MRNGKEGKNKMECRIEGKIKVRLKGTESKIEDK